VIRAAGLQPNSRLQGVDTRGRNSMGQTAGALSSSGPAEASRLFALLLRAAEHAMAWTYGPHLGKSQRAAMRTSEEEPVL
jgi:hypothetical protein